MMDAAFPFFPGFDRLQTAYVHSLHEKLVTVREAVEARHFDAAAGFGHKLKGSGMSYGFEELSRIGAQIEDAGRCRNVRRLLRLVAELEAIVCRLQQEQPPAEVS